MNVTVLADDTVGTRQTLAEHGWAVWIEAGGRRWLFDTGQGRVLSHNARELEIGLDTVDGVILSHGHYDHTGGLAALLQNRHLPLDLYMHPAALDGKYQGTAAPARYIGIPESGRQALHAEPVHLEATRRPAEVAPGIRITGGIPRLHPQEDGEHAFRCDREACDPDPLLDDQALFLDSRKGTVVVLGCAHAGVINTLDYIQSLTGEARIHAVIGGMHLGSVSAGRLRWTLDQLRRFEIQLLAPSHCTGPRAVAALWNAFPGETHPCGTGIRFDFCKEK